MRDLKLKSKGSLCRISYCRKPRMGKASICAMHHSRRLKEINPSCYFFNLLRCNAKRRGKEFNLTLTEFRLFCEETGYLKNKGRLGHHATIDRIDNEKGYSFDNIQVLSKSMNSFKADRMMRVDYFQKDLSNDD